MLRFPAVGILRASNVSFSEAAFVLLMLATVSFDGISSTALAAGVINFFLDNGFGIMLAKSLLLFGVFAFFVSLYLLFILLVQIYARSELRLISLAKHFVLSLLPIAIVYEVAHFTTLLITEGQRILILISDPFGYGWNIFGTAFSTVNYGVINFKFLWNAEVGLILLGHVVSIYIAHMVALSVFDNASTARRSQIPMLILMVGYTVLGLWILAQPPVLV